MALPDFEVLAHIQNRGDLRGGPGVFVGTRGHDLRMEGFSITFRTPVDGLGLRYFAHVAYSGDSAWMRDGQFVGSRGRRTELEGFAIELSGFNLTRYDVLYMSHVRNSGDTAWVSNGTFCGTRGQSLRVEGLAVQIVERRPQHVTLIAKATSANGQPLVITAPAESDNYMPRASAADGSDNQVWDRRPVRGGRGFALINKARPSVCLSAGPENMVVLRSVQNIDTDDNCVWRDDTRSDQHVAIGLWAHPDLTVRIAGKPPYAERGNELVLARWENGADNELWRENELDYNVVAGADDQALDVLSDKLYRGLYPKVFKGVLTIGSHDVQSVGYDITAAPRFVLRRSALFEQQAREQYAKLLDTADAEVASLASAAAASTFDISCPQVKLEAVYKGQTYKVDATLTLATKVQVNPDRSLTLELKSGKLHIPSHGVLEGVLNVAFLPLLMLFLDQTVLRHIAIPPLELIGVRFASPALATQYPHVLAATVLPPDLSELPIESSRWPTGKVFAGTDTAALNAVAKAELDRLVLKGDWQWSHHIPFPIDCTLLLHAHYEAWVHNPRFILTPSSGNTYKVHMDIGGSAFFQVKCGVISDTFNAAANGSATATATVSVDARNHVIVRFESLDALKLRWHAGHVPFLPPFVVDLILDALTPVVENIVSAALHGKSFDVYAIPTIRAHIAGSTVEITLRDLDLGSGQDGAQKPLVLATGTADVKVT